MSQVQPETVTTDGLKSCGASLAIPRLRHVHRSGRLRENNGLRTRVSLSDDGSKRCSDSGLEFRRFMATSPGDHIVAYALPD